MADYKVSYKVLKQQGEDLKSVAKLVDSYAEEIGQIVGKLGSDDMLRELRINLNRLREQLGESCYLVNIMGEVLSVIVDSYTEVEVRQVKKVDEIRAHNRDFYKNPTVVASVGVAAGGVAAVSIGATTQTTTTVINYTDNSINNTAYITKPAPAAAAQTKQSAAPAAAAQTKQSAAPAAAAQTKQSAAPTAAAQTKQSAAPAAAAQPTQSTAPAAAAQLAQSATPVAAAQPAQSATPVAAAQPAQRAAPAAATQPAQSTAPGGGMSMGAKAAIGGGAAAIAASGLIGGLELKKRRDAKKGPDTEDRYDPEDELTKAIERLRELEKEN